MKPVPFLTALLAVAGGLHAQTVSPATNANAEGPSRIFRPFGGSSTGGWRYQEIHDELKGKKLTINQLAFRRDAGISANYMSYSVNVSLVLSTAAKTAAQMAARFDDNHGANKRTVIQNKKFDFGTTVHGHVPAEFAYVLKLDRPYAFDGTNGGLCWEAQATLHTNLLTTVYLDAAFRSSSNPALALANYGDGCRHSTQVRAATASGSSSPNWASKTGTLRLHGSTLPRSSFAIAVLGFSRTNSGPIPLPFTFPGTAQGPSGPCQLLASLDIVTPIGTDQNGRSTLQFPIPMEPRVAGLQMRGQWLASDTTIPGPIPLIATNAVEYNWVPPYGNAPCSRSYASSTFSQTGTVTTNHGLVIQIK